jgi:hypothetical protein
VWDTRSALARLETNDPVVDRCVGIKGLGTGVYTYNVGVTATMIGIDFSGCDHHLIKQTFGCVYRTFAKVGGRDGVVESCLNNPHFINRQNYAGMGYCNEAYCNPGAWEGLCAVSESGTHGEGFALLRDDVLRRYCTMVQILDAENETVNNIFMYAPYRLVSAVRSEAKLLNTSADFVGFGSVYHAAEGSRLTVINALRSAGDSVVCDQSSAMTLHNRINTEIYFEGSYVSEAGNDDPDSYRFCVTDRMPMVPEGSTDGIRCVEACTDPEYSKAKNGFSYCHTAQPVPDKPGDMLYEHTFAPVDISRFMNRDGYLHMWVWVEDMSTQLWGESIQLTSSGHSDEDCLFWISTSYLTHNGWNEVWLSLADAKRRGKFDPTAANYFRMATVHNPRRNHGRTYFSDIYFCTATSEYIRMPMPQTDVDRPTAPRP